MKAIYFDMDGTIADLYGAESWLAHLQAEHTKPYREAVPLVNMRELGRELNRLQAKGYLIGVISWLPKNGSEEYCTRVEATKRSWLSRHLGAVVFNEIHIIKYGRNKEECGSGILFDDEKLNREKWNGMAYDEKNILKILRTL